MDEPCPNAETLAAYGDGKLSAAERREVERHVAGCEDCFELFAGAAVFRVEEAGASATAEHPGSYRPRIRRWSAAAAAAVVVLGVGILVRGGSETREAAEVLALADRLGSVDELRAAAAQPWSGGGSSLSFGGGVPASKRAFRAAVHLFDARVALAAGDDGRLAAALEQAAEVLPQQGEARRIVDALRRERAGTADRKDLDRLAALARAPAAATFDLGAWAEAGRLAVLLGRTDVLESELAARLDGVPESAVGDPVVRREVDAIRAALGDRRVSAAELGGLERAFRQLILVH